MLQDNLSDLSTDAPSVADPRAAWPSFGFPADQASPALRRAVARWLDLTQCWIEADRDDQPIIARQIDRATSGIAALIEAEGLGAD